MSSPLFSGQNLRECDRGYILRRIIDSRIRLFKGVYAVPAAQNPLGANALSIRGFAAK